MARGAPDWDNVGRKDISYGLHDLGEAVVRLGSVASFDRRGQVILIEDFRDGLGSVSLPAWGGASAQLVAFPTAGGGLAVRLDLPAGTGVAAQVVRRMPRPIFTRVGFEFWFQPTVNLLVVENQIVRYDGSNAHVFNVMYRHDTGDIRVDDRAVGWVTVGNVGVLREEETSYHVFKLVADIATDKYVRAALDDTTFLLDAYTAPLAANTTVPSWECIVDAEPRSGLASAVYVDNLIITHAEP